MKRTFFLSVKYASRQCVAILLRQALFQASALLFMSACLLSACSNIDCPLDNVVLMQCDLYDSETQKSLTLSDVVTVTPAGRDTVLLNQASGISSFLLPLKESGTRDTLLLTLSNSLGQEAVDTLFVEHLPQPHFESLDCPSCVFHTITGASCTSHDPGLMPLTLDSVAVVRPAVNYDDIENLRIFLRSSSDGN